MMDMGHGSGSARTSKTGSHGRNARTVAGAREIEVNAASFSFTPEEIRVGVGEDVTIVLRSSGATHDFVVKGIGHVVSAKSGRTARGGLRIDRAGTYRFWCSVPGHRSAGMTGTIVAT